MKLDPALLARPPLDAEGVLALSRGRVTSPETYSYANQRPERRGLYAEEIFGPFRPASLEEVAADPRADRFGHLELPEPLAHPRAPGCSLTHVVVVPPAYRRFVLRSAEWHREQARAMAAEYAAHPPVDGPAEKLLSEMGYGDPEAIVEPMLVEPPLNTAYRTVVNHSWRRERLAELGAPKEFLDQNHGALVRALAHLYDELDAWIDQLPASEAPELALAALGLAAPG
jgi:hypothetical protein